MVDVMGAPGPLAQASTEEALYSATAAAAAETGAAAHGAKHAAAAAAATGMRGQQLASQAAAPAPSHAQLAMLNSGSEVAAAMEVAMQSLLAQQQAWGQPMHAWGQVHGTHPHGAAGEGGDALGAASAAMRSLAYAALSAASRGDTDELRQALSYGLPAGMDTFAPWPADHAARPAGAVGAHDGARVQRTPTMVAAQVGALDCLKMLLDAGADPNARSPDDGMTALHCAAAGGSATAVQSAALLMQRGADTSAADAHGHRPVDVIYGLAQQRGTIGAERAAPMPSAEVLTALQVMLGGTPGVAVGAPAQPPAHSERPVQREQEQQQRPGEQQQLQQRRHMAGGDASSSAGVAAAAAAAAAAAMSASNGAAAQQASAKNAFPASPGTALDGIEIDRDEYQTDFFRMYEFKVRMCPKTRAHDWTECPFAHPGEKARRRDPRRFAYSGTACPDFRKGTCRRGDACEFAHGVFECWLHPSRYRTQLCKDGRTCPRRVCFFAHCPSELRAADSVPPAPERQLPPRRRPLVSGHAYDAYDFTGGSDIAADLGVPGSSPSSQHFDKRQPAKSAQGTYPSELRQIVGLPATADASMTPIGSMASRGSSDLNYSFSATGVGATGLVLGSQNYTGSSWLTAMQHGVQKPGASSLQSMKRVSSKAALSMLRVASKDSLNGQDTQWVDSLVGELDLLET